MKKTSKVKKEPGEFLHIWIPKKFKDALRAESKNESRTMQGQIHVILKERYGATCD